MCTENRSRERHEQKSSAKKRKFLTCLTWPKIKVSNGFSCGYEVQEVGVVLHKSNHNYALG